MTTQHDATGFVPVTDTEELTAWIARSSEEAVVLFMHDPFCPISGRANVEMKQLTYSPIALVDVSRQRDVTQQVAVQTGVQHESPQVIILRGGKPIWDASHFAITAEAVERMLSLVAQSEESQPTADA